MKSPEQYKDFPPGWSHLRVPLSSKRAALSGIALYASCRPLARWVQRAAWVGVKCFGPRILPGPSFGWRPPVDDETWETLAERWTQVTGPFDELAGYQRLQVSRTGLGLLLLREGIPLAFVKLRQGDAARLSNEVRALDMLARSERRTFRAPQLLLSGSLHHWHYVVVAPLEAGLHQVPTDPPISTIADEIAKSLAALPRPADTPPHWRPMHGDLAPWNLRQTASRALALLDWEDAGWGPPHADEVFYHAASAALTGRTIRGSSVMAEAAHYWRLRSEDLASGDPSRDRRMRSALRLVLDRMEASAG